MRQALEMRSHAVRARDQSGEVRGWKLFCLLPVLFFRRGPDGGKLTKEELCHRFDMFAEGEWHTLLREALIAVDAPNVRPPIRTDSGEQRGRAACRKVQSGEVTRARQCLTGAALAPGTDATLQEMQSRRPQQVQRPIPRNVLEYQPDVPLQVDRNFIKSLKSAPKGASPGPGGCTYEHLRVLLDEVGILDLLFEAVSSLAQATVRKLSHVPE